MHLGNYNYISCFEQFMVFPGINSYLAFCLLSFPFINYHFFPKSYLLVTSFQYVQIHQWSIKGIIFGTSLPEPDHQV